jgi:hypothetical protein
MGVRGGSRKRQYRYRRHDAQMGGTHPDGLIGIQRFDVCDAPLPRGVDPRFVPSADHLKS